MENFDLTKYLPSAVREAMGYNKDPKSKVVVKDFRPIEKKPGIEINPKLSNLADEIGSQENIKFNIGGSEVCFDAKAAKQYIIFSHEGNAVLVRAGKDRGKVEVAVKKAFSSAATVGTSIDISFLESAIKDQFIGEVAPVGNLRDKEESLNIILVEGKDKSPTGKTRINRITIGQKQETLLSVVKHAEKVQYTIIDYSDTKQERSQAGGNAGAKRVIESTTFLNGEDVVSILVNALPASVDAITGGPTRAVENPLFSSDDQRVRAVDWPVGQNSVPGETIMAEISRSLVDPKGGDVRRSVNKISKSVPNNFGVVLIR